MSLPIAGEIHTRLRHHRQPSNPVHLFSVRQPAASDIQIDGPGSHGMRGQAASRTCPSNSGGKNWEPTAYNPELNLLYIPSVEGCNVIETVEQKDMAG